MTTNGCNSPSTSNPINPQDTETWYMYGYTRTSIDTDTSWQRVVVGRRAALDKAVAELGGPGSVRKNLALEKFLEEPDVIGRELELQHAHSPQFWVDLRRLCAKGDEGF